MSAGKHAWFRARLVDALLELSPEDDIGRLESHAGECEECAGALARARAARPDWWVGLGHVPVGILADLARDDAAIPTAIAPFVSSHLEHCVQCRTDLADLSETARVTVESTSGVDRTSAVRRQSHWPYAIFGGIAGGGVVAAVMLVGMLLGRGTEPHLGLASRQADSRPTASASPGMGVASPSAPAKEAAPDLLVLRTPVSLMAPGRGEGRDVVTVLRVAVGERHVPVTLPSLFLAQATPLRIELCTRSGSVLATLVRPAGLALRPGAVVLDVDGLEGGRYLVRLSWKLPSARRAVREIPIEIRRST